MYVSVCMWVCESRVYVKYHALQPSLEILGVIVREWNIGTIRVYGL